MRRRVARNVDVVHLGHGLAADHRRGSHTGYQPERQSRFPIMFVHRVPPRGCVSLLLEDSRVRLRRSSLCDKVLSRST